MSKYSINTAGQGAQVFVASQLQYSALATYGEFVDSAAEGELGIFLEDNSLKTTALAAGDKFFIAMKRGGENGTGVTESFVKKTPIIDFSKIVATQTDYDAPVTQVSAVGYNGTSGSLGIDLSIPGTQELVIAVRSTAPGNQPFPVEEGRGISTRVGDLEYDVVSKMVSDLNGSYDYEKNDGPDIIYAEILSDGTVTAGNIINDCIVTKGDTSVSSTAHGRAAGSYVSLGTNVAGGGAVYKIVSVTTNAFVIDRAWEAASGTLAAANCGSIAYVDGTTELGVRITGSTVDEHFTISVQDELENATVSEIAAWKQGSGSFASILALEKEGDIFAGNGAAANAAFSTDYGKATQLAVSGLTYDRFFIDISQAITSMAAPVGVTNHEAHIALAAPSTGASPTEELTTIFAAAIA